MALVKCPGCDNMISSKTTKCPKCERDVKEIKSNKMKKNIKKFFAIGFPILILMVMIFGLKFPAPNYNIEISIKDFGKIQLELDANNAPVTVTNFVKLVNDGFYDGLTMHRIIDGFMIQGGDPLGDGTGGSEKTIKGEFTSNGVKNNISHVRGVISMARNSQSMDSASSQFFIVQKDSTYLDGEYAAFGRVIKGIDVVDEIVEKISEFGDDNGLIPKDKQPIIEYIKVIE